jgi:hypothetical protein
LIELKPNSVQLLPKINVISERAFDVAARAGLVAQIMQGSADQSIPDKPILRVIAFRGQAGEPFR